MLIECRDQLSSTLKVSSGCATGDVNKTFGPVFTRTNRGGFSYVRDVGVTDYVSLKHVLLRCTFSRCPQNVQEANGRTSCKPLTWYPSRGRVLWLFLYSHPPPPILSAALSTSHLTAPRALQYILTTTALLIGMRGLPHTECTRLRTQRQLMVLIGARQSRTSTP